MKRMNVDTPPKAPIKCLSRQGAGVLPRGIGCDSDSHQDHHHHACRHPEHTLLRPLPVLGVRMSPQRLASSPRPYGRAFAFLFNTLALLLLLNFCPLDAHAQDETPEESDEVVRVSADLVTVPFFVTDS